MKYLMCAVAALFAFVPSAAAAVTYSTGSIDAYMPENPNLTMRNSAAAVFRFWYTQAGHTLVSSWTDNNVWPTDFIDQGSPNDEDGGGGSDLPKVYLYAGHGSCENAPVPAGSSDFIVTHNNSTNFVDIGASSVWGNGGSQHQFMFLDASCPMDLPSLTSQWFAPFGGLHIATGHSGDNGNDTLDSTQRVAQFAVKTVGFAWMVGQMPVGDAWMTSGITDVQSGTCAVITAAGSTEADAVNRREHEFVTSGWGNPSNNWIAWRWICAP